MSKGQKVVTLQQNEGGVIFSGEQEYIGLLTHNVKDCVGVVLFDDVNGKYALQHHDICSDETSIADYIREFDFQNPRVVLVINEHYLRNEFTFNEEGEQVSMYEIAFSDKGTLYRIKAFLDEQNIAYEEKSTPTNYHQGKTTSNHGVLVTKDGVLDLNYTKINHGRCGNWLDIHGLYDMDADEVNPEKNTVIANLRLFKEKTKIFTRYDGANLSQEDQSLSYLTSEYIRSFRDEAIYNYEDVSTKLLEDIKLCIFGEKEASNIQENFNMIIDNIFTALQNNWDYRMLGCSPMPGYIIANGQTIVPENEAYQALYDERDNIFNR